MHVRVLLPEDLCNRSPGFRALAIREETLPPTCCLPNRRPVGAYQTALCRDSSRIPPHPAPLRLRHPLPPWSTPQGPCGEPSPKVPSTWCSWPGPLGPYGRPTSLLEQRGQRRGVSRSSNSCQEPPHHSAAKIAVKRRPTDPKGVAYQLAD